MARGIQERQPFEYLPALALFSRFDGGLEGADVLRDPAEFACGYIGLSDRVQQRRLSVIDVSHDDDHGRADDRAGRFRFLGATGGGSPSGTRRAGGTGLGRGTLGNSQESFLLRDLDGVLYRYLRVEVGQDAEIKKL